MKTNHKVVFALIVSMITTNLVFAQATSDYDKTVDFTKFKTYTFLGWAQNSDKILNDFDKKRILESFRDELTKRGMTLSDSTADVAITLYIVIDDKTSTTAYTNYNGGMGYGYGGRWGYGYRMGYGGMGSASTTYSEDNYKEGTVVIDFYENATKKLAWQGVLTTVVKENPKKREKSIPKNVNKLMYKYPVKPTK